MSLEWSVPNVVAVRNVPWWGLLSSGAAPVLVVGGWTVATSLQPRCVDPMAETVSALAAVDAAKTGTLTLNQMTAVQMTAAGRRYAIDGQGYSTAGRITRVTGEADIGLDEVLMPMVPCSDAVVRDGELVGDPTEGALVVLAAKGGIASWSARTTRCSTVRPRGLAGGA
jgi:hypothetical protein